MRPNASLLLLLAIGLSACGSTDDVSTTKVVRGTVPAVMVGVIGTSPEGRATYVGAFPTVPTGAVTTDDMVEFGDAYFYAFDGSVFVWEREEARITRYEVSDAFKLGKGKAVSFVSYGLKFDGELTFVSPKRAYMMMSGSDLVVVWDPSVMEITGTFKANIPVRDNLDTYPAAIGVSGGRVYWAPISMNSDALTVYPKNVLAIAPADADGPVTVIEDDRCIPSLGGYIASNGDIYLVGGADADAIQAYNPGAGYPPSCILRVKAGDTKFDPDYYFDLRKATGSKSVVGTWRINDQSILARVWDPSEPLPTLLDDYWSGQSFVSKSVDLLTGVASDFPALPKGGFSSNIQDRVDSATYFSLPNDDGSADVAYRLKPEGIEEAFSIPGGGYWGMSRIR